MQSCRQGKHQPPEFGARLAIVGKGDDLLNSPKVGEVFLSG